MSSFAAPQTSCSTQTLVRAAATATHRLRRPLPASPCSDFARKHLQLCLKSSHRVEPAACQRLDAHWTGGGNGGGDLGGSGERTRAVTRRESGEMRMRRQALLVCCFQLVLYQQGERVYRHNQAVRKITLANCEKTWCKILRHNISWRGNRVRPAALGVCSAVQRRAAQSLAARGSLGTPAGLRRSPAALPRCLPGTPLASSSATSANCMAGRQMGEHAGSQVHGCSQDGKMMGRKEKAGDEFRKLASHR